MRSHTCCRLAVGQTLHVLWGQIQQEAGKQGPRGVHVIWLQELMVTLGRTVSREAEGEGEERGQGDGGLKVRK